MPERMVDLLYALKNKCAASDQEFIAKGGVSQSEYQMFLALTASDAISCQGVAEKTGLSPSRVSRILDKMASDGYLVLEENPDDRRQKNIRLTPAGKAVVVRIEEFRAGCEQKLLESFEQEQIDIFKSCFRRVLNAL